MPPTLFISWSLISNGSKDVEFGWFNISQLNDIEPFVIY